MANLGSDVLIIAVTSMLMTRIACSTSIYLPMLYVYRGKIINTTNNKYLKYY